MLILSLTGAIQLLRLLGHTGNMLEVDLLPPARPGPVSYTHLTLPTNKEV